MLGVAACVAPLAQGITLYWEPRREKAGYFTDIYWNSTGGIKSIFGIWDSESDRLAGLSLDDIHSRSQKGWYYAKEPIPLIPFGVCVGISHKFERIIKENLGPESLSGFIVQPELYGREFYLCAVPVNELFNHKKRWNDLLLGLVDSSLAKHISGKDQRAELEEYLGYLPHLFTSLSDGEQFHLRRLLRDHPDLDRGSIEKLVEEMSGGNKIGYRLINFDQSLRFERSDGVIIPSNLMFASTNNALKAAQALRKKLGRDKHQSL